VKRHSKDKPSYPALVDLVARLKDEGRSKDAEICSKALYYLNRQDAKIDKLRKDLALMFKNNLIF
jgi:hypothetical protein